MKRIIMFVMLACMVAFGAGIAVAQECISVVVPAVSATVLTGDSYAAAGGLLSISSTTIKQGRIYTMTITNTDIAVPQTVTAWHYFTGNSSATTVRLWEVAFASGSTASQSVTVNFPAPYPLVFTKGLGLTKSSAGSVVKASIQYR